MKVRLVRNLSFEAAHRLPKVPPGHKCERLHGHSFRIDIIVEGEVNPETGWFIDYSDIDDAWAPIHDKLDHHYLNEVPGLENPTSEILAGYLWEKLKTKLPSLSRIVVHETCDASCEYEGL